MSASPSPGPTRQPPASPGSNGGAPASDWSQRIMWVVWPAFLVAGFAEVVFFTLVDPEDLHFFGGVLLLSRTAIYTVGFFCFWAVCALSSAMTIYLACGETGKVKGEGALRR
jgi:hypothetical protein